MIFGTSSGSTQYWACAIYMYIILILYYIHIIMYVCMCFIYIYIILYIIYILCGNILEGIKSHLLSNRSCKAS